MKNMTRRFITNAFALALAGNSLTAFAQNAPQDKPQEKKVERAVFVDTAGSTFDLTVPAPDGVTGAMPRTMSFVSSTGGPQDHFSYSFVASEVGSTSKLVKGQPYSAEIVNEFVQTLANGNRIVRRTASNSYRDGQGRTRREMGGPAIVVPGMPADASPGKMTVITDPVEGFTYMLDDKSKTARRLKMGQPGTAGFVSSNGKVMVMTNTTTVTGAAPSEEIVRKITVSSSVLQNSAISKVQPAYPPIAKASRAAGAVQVQVAINETGDVVDATAISGHPLLRDSAVEAARQWKFKPTELAGKPVKVQGTLTFNFSLKDDSNQSSEPAPGNETHLNIAKEIMLQKLNAKTTPLGRQIIEGIECEGTKIVETIPAGQVGNEQPIEIVIERWFSPELQLTVLSKHSDPRHGETTVRMQNLLRTEPDAYLFKVPSDYTIKDGSAVFTRITKPE
jgi:TonB family protein